MRHRGFDRVIAHRIYFLVAAHIVIAAIAYHLAFQLRFDFSVPVDERIIRDLTLPLVVLVKLLIFHRFGSFHGWWRYVTFEDLAALLRVATLSTLVVTAADHFVIVSFQIPRSVLVLDWCLTILLFGGLRSVWRLGHEGIWARLYPKEGVAALLVAADENGIALARQINGHPRLSYRIVGFLDDSESRWGSRLGGIPVVGGTENAVVLADQNDAREIVVVSDNVYGQRLRDLMERCRGANIRVKVIPSMGELLNGSHRVQIRDVDIEDLLRREPVELDVEAIEKMLASRCVLVTGAGGSIGSEICCQIARCRPAKLVLAERAENTLFQIEQKLLNKDPTLPLVPCVVDIGDRRRLESVFARHRPEIVFHAAAHKHVPMMEANPGEAIANNVLGTKLVADLSHAHGADRFVLISTDKAVNPASVMGASKLLAERYIHAFSERSPTRFVVVRFGNVLASNGSVVPIFQEQIRRGGPVTVTHPQMKRYFMTISEASQLVLQAASIGKGGEVFVLDMGQPISIVNLAEDLIRLSGYAPGEIEIKFIGCRPGEKLFEELLLSDEETLSTSHPKLRTARHAFFSFAEACHAIGRLAEVIHEDKDVIRERLREVVPEYAPAPIDEENAVAAPPPDTAKTAPQQVEESV